MFSWQELSQQLQQITNTFIRFVKARRREEAAIGVAAILFWIGYSLIKWLPSPLPEFIKSWRIDLIIPSVSYVAGLVFLGYGIYHIWKLVHTPDLPPPANRPSAIKGPHAFTPADGELFRKLGREDELRKLLGYIQDDQVRLVVLMGASGAGKTSLLRAGLTDILKDTDIKYHYWEAVPAESGRGLLTAIQQSWVSKLNNERTNGPNPTASEFKSLDELINPTPELGKHVVVLDQFEQLGASENGPVFRLLRKVIREAKPPHRITWVIAFRREFRADWSDFIIPEHERGFFPPELSLRLFTSEQARDVISQLIRASGLSVEQKIINNLIEAATVEGEVSSVDIGIGLLVLSELYERQGAKTLTQDSYQFAGGAEGLLTQYVNRCLDNFPDEDRKTLLSAMLALRDAETDQRVAEGKSCVELAAEIQAANIRRLRNQLERLTQRDMRLLEHSAASKQDEVVRYRLPHERLIASLNRLAGRLIGELEEAKGKLENAFPAWKRNNASQYLLRGRDLRLVQRYRSQIAWGKDEAEKLNFLKLSQRRRTLKQLTLVMLITFLTACGWFAVLQYQRDNYRRSLRDNGYPPELYDYQQQLKKLELFGIIDTQRLLWLRSNSLEEFTITVGDPTLPGDRFSFGNALTLDGLCDSLTRCTALKHLTLDITPNEVESLEPLTKLSNLTHLTLHISGRGVDIVNLEPLAKLPNLTHLTLNIQTSYSALDLEPLTRLPNLTRLSLKIDSGDMTMLEPIAKLSTLTQLDLNIGSWLREVSNLESLTKLPNLTQLTLDLNDSPKTNLELLAKLPARTNLILNIGDSQVEKVAVLAKVPNLTQLALDISDNKVTNLEPLAKLSNLTKLTFHLNGSQVSDLESLVKLPNLKQLYLDLHYDKVAHMESLVKLTNLTQLTLKMSDYDLTKLEPLAKLPPHTQLILDLHRSEAIDFGPLAKLPNLTQLYLDISDRYKGVTNLEPLVKVVNLKQLNLYISGAQVAGLEPLAKLPNTTRLNLDINGSQTNDFGPLLKLNCQTLKLHSTAKQRSLLNAIPKSVTELSF